jgi:malonate-semialdehyde dehydrogenase (acetylating) / methylmalonate-semialdehyde dehydrogenase
MSISAVPAATAPLHNFIDGRWQPALATETLEDRDPASGELIAQVPLSGAEDVDAAVTAAAGAADAWRSTPPQQRARALFALRALLVEHREELAQLVTRDMGKTLDDARAEVGRGIESVEAACAVPHLMKGENLEGVARALDVEMVRQPVGVVAAITPFNFPVMIPLWFLPYALATGNTLVLKPSEQDPLPSRRLIELVSEVEELPAGVVNLVHGGRSAVDALLEHPHVDAVSFVGSTATARHIAARATATGKRVQALGGAKNSMILMPDADPQLMLSGLLGSAFGAAGQRCLAGSVAVLVGTPEQQQATQDRVVQAASELRCGAGADPGTDVCPLVNAATRVRLDGEIDAALAAGAELVLDGRVPDGGEAGTLLGATIIDGLEPESRWLREELFGPLLCLVRAPDLDAAIDWVNASRYGNSAIIFTSAGRSARRFRERVQAGMLGVNVGVAAPVAWFPFAGWKDSFAGTLHANGTDAFEFYTRKKVVTTRWS